MIWLVVFIDCDKCEANFINSDLANVTSLPRAGGAGLRHSLRQVDMSGHQMLAIHVHVDERDGERRTMSDEWNQLWTAVALVFKRESVSLTDS